MAINLSSGNRRFEFNDNEYLSMEQTDGKIMILALEDWSFACYRIGRNFALTKLSQNNPRIRNVNLIIVYM